VASTPVVAHLESVIRLASDTALPAGPVLLVATDVRTRWTATVAAALLREQGASQVLVLALHLRP
jgi:ATP-dependent DNA helicase RecQ